MDSSRRATSVRPPSGTTRVVATADSRRPDEPSRQGRSAASRVLSARLGHGPSRRSSDPASHPPGAHLPLAPPSLPDRAPGQVFGRDGAALRRSASRRAHRRSSGRGRDDLAPTLGDLAVTAASERLRRDRTVAHSLAASPSTSSRVLGLVWVVGGAVLLAAFVVDIAPGLNVLRLV